MREFWSKLLLVVLPFCAVNARGSDPEPVDGVRLSWNETIRTYPRAGRLTTVCRSENGVYACTEMTRSDFLCRCEEEGLESWRIRISIVIDAAIHTVDPRYLVHERMHVLELQKAIPKQLAHFAGLRFPTRERCEVLARHISGPSFGADFMNAVLAESNQIFQCYRVNRRPPPVRERARPAVFARKQ